MCPAISKVSGWGGRKKACGVESSKSPRGAHLRNKGLVRTSGAYRKARDPGTEVEPGGDSGDLEERLFSDWRGSLTPEGGGMNSCGGDCSSKAWLGRKAPCPKMRLWGRGNRWCVVIVFR